MFRATMCPSSGETTVFMRHLVLVNLCEWLYGAPCITDSHPYRITSTKSHKYSCLSWWWTHSRPKHVEKRNKHTKKKSAPSWLCLQDSFWSKVSHYCLSTADWTETKHHLHIFIFIWTLLICLIHKPLKRKGFEIVFTNQTSIYTVSLTVWQFIRWSDLLNCES